MCRNSQVQNINHDVQAKSCMIFKTTCTYIPSTLRGRSLWSARLSAGLSGCVCRRPTAAPRPKPAGNRSFVRRFWRPRAAPSVPCEKFRIKNSEHTQISRPSVGHAPCSRCTPRYGVFLGLPRSDVCVYTVGGERRRSRT